MRDILPFLLLVYSTLLPAEMRVSLSGQIIYPYRAAIFAILPWLILNLAGGALKPRLGDALFGFGSLWILVAFVVNYGPLDGILRGGALVLDILPPYVAARIAVKSPDDLRRILVFLAPGIGMAGFFMAIEAITHVAIIRPVAASIFGPLPFYSDGQAMGQAQEFIDYRLGLRRAMGPFSQPILAGLFLASLMPLYVCSGLRGWPFWIGLAASLCSVFSVSSAVILALGMSIGVMAYQRLQEIVTFLNWRIFLAISSFFILAAHILSQNGIVSVLIRYTLNPVTGYYRLLIWEYGMKSVWANPWFGIGFNDFPRPAFMSNSVDAHWLLYGIRYGFITPICIFFATAAAIAGLSFAAQRYDLRNTRFLVAFAGSLAALAITAFTTSFFGEMHVWFAILLGMAISIPEGRKRSLARPLRHAREVSSRVQVRSDLSVPRSQ